MLCWASAYNLAKKIFAPYRFIKVEGEMYFATYLGTVKLGGFYNNGAALVRPTKPWRPDNAAGCNNGYGNIPQMSGGMANYTIGNTPADEAKRLQWVKIKDGDKTLLICDRVILVSVSWDDLNGQGYVSGKTINIDGARYKWPTAHRRQQL